MPIIKINIPKDKISKDEKAQLLHELCDEVLEAEGLPAIELTRSLEWCLIKEFDNENWAIAGTVNHRFNIFMEIYFFKSVIDENLKKITADKVNSVFKNIFGDKLDNLWIVINEVPDYSFIVNGKPVSMNDLKNLINMNIMGAEVLK